MKFLLELVTCCGSRSSAPRQPAEETRLLVVQEPPRRRPGRRHGRVRGGCRGWRPSLSSISEDALMADRINKAERPVAGWRRKLKRKVSSMSQRDRSRSLDHDDGRRGPSVIMPAFPPTPFMF